MNILTPQHRIALLYHTVENTPSPFHQNLFPQKTPEQFRKEVRLFKSRFHPVSLEEWLENAPSSRPLVHFTFDDGWRSILHFALPILEEERVSATLFVCPKFISQDTSFYRVDAQETFSVIDKLSPSSTALLEILALTQSYSTKEAKQKILQYSYHDSLLLSELRAIALPYIETSQAPYFLSIQELKNLQSSGFTIGAHSLDHPKFSLLSQTERLYQTKESLAILKEWNLCDHAVFAYPFDNLGINVQEMQEINALTAHSFGTSGMKVSRNSRHTERLNMDVAWRNTSAFLVFKQQKQRILNGLGKGTL